MHLIAGWSCGCIQREYLEEFEKYALDGNSLVWFRESSISHILCILNIGPRRWFEIVIRANLESQELLPRLWQCIRHY